MHRLSQLVTERRHTLVLMLLPLALAGCVAVQDTLPQDIAPNGTPLAVQNRGSINGFFGDGSFEVGGYRISKIQRDATSSSQFSIGPYREKRSKTGFRFVFSGEAASWQVQCSKQFNGNVIRVLGVDGVSDKDELRCNLQKNGAAENASFDLVEAMESPQGSVLFGKERYALRPYSYGNVRHDVIPVPLGFRVDGQNGNLAALELRQPGKVWLNRDLAGTQRDVMVGVMAALLINEATPASAATDPKRAASAPGSRLNY